MQEDHEFKADLGYLDMLCLKTMKHTSKNTGASWLLEAEVHGDPLAREPGDAPILVFLPTAWQQ